MVRAIQAKSTKGEKWKLPAKGKKYHIVVLSKVTEGDGHIRLDDHPVYLMTKGETLGHSTVSESSVSGLTLESRVESLFSPQGQGQGR